MQLQANPSSEGLCFAQPCKQAESSPKMGSSAISRAWTLFQLCASRNAVQLPHGLGPQCRRGADELEHVQGKGSEMVRARPVKGGWETRDPSAWSGEGETRDL